MAVLKVIWRADIDLALTLTSLADAAYRQSAAWDNTTNDDPLALYGGSVQVGTSPSAGGTIEFFAYGQWDNAPKYTANASGSDAGYTADGNENNLIWLGSVEVDGTNDQDYPYGPWPLHSLFGGHMPERGGVVAFNNTGATLNATGTNNLSRITFGYEDIS